MMFALGCGPAAVPVQRLGRAIALPPPAIAAIAADAWTATMPAPADLALLPVPMISGGYDAAGNPATFAHTVATTKRIRRQYPNHAALTADKVALSDCVYNTDAIAGVATAACPDSPKPVMQWADVDRQLVGDTLTLEVTAFHRDGMAAVRFFVGDGSTTLTATAPTPTISPRAGDRQAVIVYRATVDIASLANPVVLTVNAWGYPRRGGAGSIRKSDDLAASDANRRLFSPRVYVRDTARFAAPPLVHVAPGGNDGTGAVSTNPATAAAAPCATITGALTRARAVLGTGSGALNSLRVRLAEGTHVWAGNGPSVASTIACEAIIEAAPGAAKANTILSMGGATARFNLAFVRLRGITVLRTGALGTLVGNTAGFHTALDDVALQNAGQTAALGTTVGTGLYLLGGTAITGIAGASSLLKAGNVELRLMRGVTASPAGAGDCILAELWNVLGCTIHTAAHDNSANRDRSGGVVAFNRFLSLRNSTDALIKVANPAGGLTDGFALVQNVIEPIGTDTTFRAISISGDAPTDNSTRHVILWHNTAPGFDLIGRPNIFYDETTGVLRNHTMMSVVGNIFSQINTKHDIFQGANHGDANAHLHVGGWSFLYGVGCRGNFTMFRDASGSNGPGGFAQDYAGLSARIGTSNTAAQSPLFDAPAHTAGLATPGAGGGTYTLQPASPARGLVAASPVPFDLAGNARGPGMAAAGAYS